MDYMQFFCSFVGVLCFVAGYSTIFGAFLEEGKPRKRMERGLPHVIYFIGYVFLYGIWPKHETWLDLLLGSVISIIIYLMYGASLAKAMTGTSLAISIALLADAILVLVASILQFYMISEELFSLFLLQKETMGIGILFLALTKLFSVFFNRSLPRSELAKRLYHAGANVMPLLCIVSAVTIVQQVYVLQIDDLTIESLFVAVVTLVLLALMSFYQFGELKETETLQMEKSKMEMQQLAYAHELKVEQEAYEKTQRLRHDMKNHIILLGAFLKHKEYDQISEYISRIYRELEGTRLYSNSGCKDLDIILNYKLSDAQEKGIQTEVSVLVPRQIGIDTFDLNVLLGNLLDNALEGVERCTEKKISVKVRFAKGVVYLEIRNTYDGILERDSKGCLRTRKEEKEQHSIGLKSVANVVNKYDGEIQIHTSEQEFAVYVVMYPKSGDGKKESEFFV